ncbi:MAG: restriction endonuclease subunit S, partial [Minisyncoccia bacterium]
ILGIDASTNQAVAGMIVNQEILDRRFLYFFLLQMREEIIASAWGGAQPNLSQTILKEIEIPLPTLKTQKEIVAKLDEKFAKLKEAKRLREEALADTEKILSQTLREIFEEGKSKGWEEKEMGDVLDKIIGGGTPSKANSNYWNGDIPWASVKDLKEDQRLIEKTKDFITKEGLENSSANLIPKGSLIISTRMGLGRVAKNTIDLAINQDLKALIPKKIIDIDFLTFVLMNKSQEIISGGKGATVSGVTLDFFKKIKILLPSLSEQQKIVTKLDKLSEKIRTLHELQTSQLADFKRLEKSYLREAFNGELI